MSPEDEDIDIDYEGKYRDALKLLKKQPFAPRAELFIALSTVTGYADSGDEDDCRMVITDLSDVIAGLL